MFSLNNCTRHLNIKEPPIGTHNLDSLYNSFDNMSACNAVFITPPALDDTTSTSAQNLNIHIRDPQNTFNYIISSDFL